MNGEKALRTYGFIHGRRAAVLAVIGHSWRLSCTPIGMFPVPAALSVKSSSLQLNVRSPFIEPQYGERGSRLETQLPPVFGVGGSLRLAVSRSFRS